MLFAAILFGVAQATLPASDADLSRRLTSAAEELLKIEKKVAAVEGGLDALLYEDVLALLDAALHANPQNLHARVVSSDVLLLKANDGVLTSGRSGHSRRSRLFRSGVASCKRPVLVYVTQALG